MFSAHIHRLSSEESLYKPLFRRLRDHAGRYEIAGTAQPNILRVGLAEMDSTLMMDDDPSQLVQFAFALKSLARHKLTVVVMTLLGHDDESLMELSDFWFDLTASAAPKSQKSQSSGYHGVMTVNKLPNLKTLKCPLGSTYGSRYHFKSTKSKFTLEKIHLPPAEFEEPAAKPSLHTVGNDW